MNRKKKERERESLKDAYFNTLFGKQGAQGAHKLSPCNL